MSLANNGNVVIALKTPYVDGTTHVVLSPMEFMGRLAALVPKPRVKMTGTPSPGFMACSRGATLRPIANCVKTLFRKNL